VRRNSAGPFPVRDENDRDETGLAEIYVTGEGIYFLRAKLALVPPRVYVDGHHVALEGSREGIRFLNCGAFGHRPFGDTLEGPLEHPYIPEQHVNLRHRAPSRCPVVRGDQALRCEYL
jgi:hypothetical protein